MAVKVIIQRRVKRENSSRLEPLLIQLRALATSQPGYISGETLRNVNDPEEYLVVSTWKAPEHWKAWSESKQRKEIQEEIESLLGGKTECTIYWHG